MMKDVLRGGLAGAMAAGLFCLANSFLIDSSLPSTINKTWTKVLSYCFWNEFATVASALTGLGIIGAVLSNIVRERYPKARQVSLQMGLNICISLIAVLILLSQFRTSRTDFNSHGWKTVTSKSDRADMLFGLFTSTVSQEDQLQH